MSTDNLLIRMKLRVKGNWFVKSGRIARMDCLNYLMYASLNCGLVAINNCLRKYVYFNLKCTRLFVNVVSQIVIVLLLFIGLNKDVDLYKCTRPFIHHVTIHFYHIYYNLGTWTLQVLEPVIEETGGCWNDVFQVLKCCGEEAWYNTMPER